MTDEIEEEPCEAGIPGCCHDDFDMMSDECKEQRAQNIIDAMQDTYDMDWLTMYLHLNYKYERRLINSTTSRTEIKLSQGPLYTTPRIETSVKYVRENGKQGELG